MSIQHRVLAATLVVLSAVGIPSPARAASVPLAPAAPMACADGDQPSGARYRICMPGEWNGDLVIFAHGYVAPTEPPGLPEDQLTIGGISLADYFTGLGYGFAASGYRRNGLAILEGLADTVELVDVFTGLHGQPDRVILVGVSEGGAIAALGIERFPEVFHGGLALCGPYGDFQRQVDHFAGFRTVFDYYFPGLIPPTVIDVPPDLLNTWETGYYSFTVRPAIVDPANAISVTQVLSVTGAPVDPKLPATTEATFERLLWYHTFSTNDGQQQLGGNPFGNQAVQYAGSLDDAALNAGVARFTAEVTATNTISASYQTTGRLTRPLITMHTTGDPIVPYWHAERYGKKVIAAGSGALYKNYRVEAYGHCAFDLSGLNSAFDELARWANQRPIYLPLVTRGS